MEDMLNTGCFQTLVRQLELVTEDKLTSRRASICCAHGGILQYPIADVQIRMGDMEFTVKAGVSDRLPRSVLLGTDVPAWRELLNGALAEDGGCLPALIVTRAQRAAMEKEEAERVEKEVAPGAKPSPVEDETESCQVSPVTYEIDVSRRCKKRKIAHVNMLKRWNEPVQSCYWTEDVSDNGDDDEVPTWCNDQSSDETPTVGWQLNSKQQADSVNWKH